MKKRDSQRQKVYNWEDRVWYWKSELIPRKRNLTTKQAEILIALCRARFGLFKPLRLRKTRSDANHSWYINNFREHCIAIQPDMFDEPTIIHEASHSIARGHQHHPYFVKVYIELMGFIAGGDRVGIRQLATKMRVKWRHRYNVPPQGKFKTQIASLRRKYRRSFDGEFMHPKWDNVDPRDRLAS